MILAEHYIALAFLVFVICLVGGLRRRGQVALVVISAMVATLAALIVFVSANAYAEDAMAPYWVLALILAASAQAGVAAALMICVYRRRGALALRRINAPRG